MASKTTVYLIDDLNGDTAHETVAFSLDGADYEIDLTDQNAEHLRAALVEYVKHARRIKRPRSQGKRRTALNGTTAKRQDLSDIRRWAGENGYQVSERGRVPAHVVSAYDQATKTTVKLADPKPAESKPEVRAAEDKPAKPAATPTTPQFSRAAANTGKSNAGAATT